MHCVLPYKIKQFFFVLVKISIVIGAFYFIYFKLIHNDTLDVLVFYNGLQSNNFFSIKNVIILLLLTCLNWFFEILKWKTLVQFVRKLSFIEALKQSLGALTASLFTPNRIGEYVAKDIYFKKEKRKRIVLLNLISNVTQMNITIVFGAIGLWFFNTRYAIFNSLKVCLIILGFTIILGLTLFIIKKLKYKIKGFLLAKIIQYIKNLPKRIVVLTWLFSMLRYVVFSFQFYFILQIFGVSISYFNAMIVISSLYFLSSIIPTLFIFDVIVKGSVAVFLFSFLGVNELTVLSVITLMWLLNFVLPSVIGSYFVLNFKIIKTE